MQYGVQMQNCMSNSLQMRVNFSALMQYIGLMQRENTIVGCQLQVLKIDNV